MSNSFEHPSAAARGLTARVNAVLDSVKGAFPWRRGVGVVLEALAKFCDGRGWCFVSLARLREELKRGYSLRHLQRLVDCAERLGLLVRAVPRPGARLMGTASEYALPWWALSVEQASEGALKVLQAKAKGPVAAGLGSKLGQSVLSAVERANPLELVRRVAKLVGGSLGFDLVREASRKASLLGASAGVVVDTNGELLSPLHRTPGPDKTSEKIPSLTLAGDTRPDVQSRDVDRGAAHPASGSALWSVSGAAAVDRIRSRLVSGAPTPSRRSPDPRSQKEQRG